jgi:hypothetical protein
MGFLDRILPKRWQSEASRPAQWQTSVAYSPVFSSRQGGIYEMELTRAAINAKASACAKLEPQVIGYRKTLDAAMKSRPNPFQDTYKFLYRLCTILESETTAIVVPMLASDSRTVTGYFTAYPSRVEVVESGGGYYLRFSMPDGKRMAVDLDKVGILTKYQLKDDFFGSGNRALEPTLDLLHANSEGMVNGIKSGSSTRLLVKLSSNTKPDDIKREKERFIKDNMQKDSSGIVFADNKYDEVKQLVTKPYLVDASQQELIQRNVFNYFGVNEKILQNTYSEDEYNAFYEGVVEPFAIQLSQVLTNMTFTDREQAFGNKVVFSDNRLQYASNKTKITYAQTMFDRGLASTNDIMDIFNRPRTEGGDDRYIRKEYTKVADMKGTAAEGNDDGQHK